MGIDEITKLAIAWGPTILFLLIFIVGLILGFARGFRKSVILAIQALVILGVCLTAYFIIVNNPNTDTMVVKTVNGFLGEGWLQAQMGVSPNCEGLKEMLVEFIPKQLPYGDGLALIVQENGQYLASLVNLAYHIVFAVAFSIIYLLLVFVLYLIYFIAYPERRHKKKLQKKLAKAQTTKKYKKRVLLGGLIGGSRGLVSGLVCMSFLGAIFFILAGGTGGSKNDDYEYDFGDDQINTVHSIYKNIGSYGESGIFKVLNSIKNKDDVPYYLFAAEMVLQGGDVSIDGNVKSNIALTNELSSIVKFGRQSLDLILQNDDEGVIKDIVLNGTGNKDIMTEITKIMAKKSFQASFEAIIDDFNANTYFVNLGLSLIDSICRNIDTLELGLSPDVTELICILFKPGYKSDYIEEDKLHETPAYISASTLLNEADSKHLVKTAIKALGLNMGERDETQKILALSKEVVPSLKELTILSSDKKTTFNPLLERLYSYVINRYVVPEGGEQVSLSSLRAEIANNPNEPETDWIDEILKALDLSVGAINIADNVYVPGINLEKDYLDLVHNIFDSQYPTYNENIESYNVIKNSLASSSLLSRVMSENGMYQMLEGEIKKLAPEAYMEENISYINEYDENGNIVKHGEVYNLLTAVEKTMMDSETYGVIKEATDGSLDAMTEQEMMSFVKRLATILTKDTDGSSPADVLLDSSIASSLLSGIIISKKDDLKLYIPEDETVLKKVDGKFVNLIHKEQITYILDYVPELMDAIIPFMDSDKSNPDSNNIDSLINRLKPSIDSGLLNSMILEGTIVNYLEEPLLNSEAKNFITIPAEYMDGAKLNVSKWIETNEIETMITGLLKSELKLNAIMNATPETQQEVILEQVRRIGELEGSEDVTLRPVTALLESKVLHASVSGILIQDEGEKPLIEGFTIVIPKESVANSLINKNEISTVIKNIPDVLDTVMPFITEGDAAYNDVDRLIGLLTARTALKPSIADNLLESQILGQTLALKLTEILTGPEIGDYIKLPADLLPADDNYLYNWTDSTNNEIKNLLYAIPASGLSINTFMNGELTNDKLVEQVTNIGKQSDAVLRDEVFGSRVLHKTVSNLLITFNSNGVEIVVPNPSRVSDDLSLVRIDELVDLLHAVPKLLAADMTNQNELVKAIINNADELLAIPSLLTTVVNYLNLNVFDSIAYDEVAKPDGLIVIPTKLREDADKDTSLMAYDPSTNSNAWQNEALSLIKSLDTMLGLSSLDSFDLNDQAWMSKTLSDNIKLLNDPYVEGSAATRLEVVYKSTIMTSTLTHNLDKVLEDESLSNAAAYNRLKEDGIVPAAEMATLVDVAKELNLDLLSFNTDLLLNQLKSLNTDSIVKPGTSKSDLIYESNIAKILLTKQLDTVLEGVIPGKINIIDVKTTNALFNGVFTYYKPAEIKELINMFNYLEIEDIKNPSFTELRLDNDLKTIVSGSNIIKAVLTGELQKLEQIVLPKDILVNDSYINNEELNRLLDVLITKKDSLFGAPVGNKYNITSFNANNITVGLLKSLATSEILSATAINALNDMNSKGTIKGVVIPTEYVVTKDTLVNSYSDTLWNKNSELNNLINALGIIASDNDLLTALDEAKVLAAADNLLVTDGAGKTNLSKAYTSAILQASLTKTLDDLLTPDILDQAVKEHELSKELIKDTTTSAYRLDELDSAIRAIQSGLGISHVADFNDVAKVKAQILKLNEDNLGYLYDSYIVWSALELQIDKVVNSLTENKANLIGAKKDYVKNTISGGNRYTVGEITQIINLFKDQNITSLDGLALTSLRLDGDIKNIVLHSNIIKAALTVQVEKLGGIIVPKDCYNTLYPFIDDNEIASLLDILIDNRVALFGPAVNGKHDFTSFNTNNITFGILKSVASSMIFTATAIDQINGLKVGIVVPNEYKTTKDTLINSYKTTLWHTENEFNKLVNSLGVFLNDNDKLTEINEETIKNKVDSLLTATNGVTNLHRAYESVIVKASLAGALDGILTEAVVSPLIREHALVKEKLTLTSTCYKESEVEAIIRALQEGLGITNISGFTNVDAVKDKILSLDKTKLGYLHSSYIIWSILSEQIDTVVNTLTKNNANNIGAKEAYMITGGDRYKEAEVLALVQMLNHLGIADINTPSLDAIKLDNDFKTIVLKSNILKSALTEVLKGVPAIVIPGDAYNTKYNIIISNENIDSLLTVLINNKDALFGAPVDGKYNVSSFNTDGITLNLLASLISSNILHATAIKAIATMGLAGVTIPTEYQSASNSFTVFNDNIWVKSKEISNLINALGVFVSDANAPIKNAFDENTIKNSVDGLLTATGGVTNLDRIYTSALAKASLATALDGILTDSIVEASVKSHSSIRENVNAYSSFKAYKASEVEAIIHALKDVFHISSIAGFNDVTVIKDAILGLTAGNVDTLHKSAIVWSIMSKELDKVLAPAGARDNVLDYSREKLSGTDVNMYKVVEVKKLLNAIKNGLGISSIDGIKGGSDILLNAALNMNVAYESAIVRDIIASKLDTVFAGGVIKKHSSAVITESLPSTAISVSYYKVEEVNELIGLMKDLGADFNSFSLDSLVINDNLIARAKASMIINATITDKLIKTPSLLLPQDKIELIDPLAPTIEASELESLLRAIGSLSGMSLGSLNINSLKPNSITDANIAFITGSAIMRANITANIKGAGVKMTVSTAEASIVNKYNSTDRMYVLSANELKAAIAAIKLLNPESFTIKLDLNTIKAIKKTDIYTMYDSSLMATILSQFVLANGYSTEVPMLSQLDIVNRAGAIVKYDLTSTTPGKFKLHDASLLSVYTLTDTSYIASSIGVLKAEDIVAFITVLEKLGK